MIKGIASLISSLIEYMVLDRNWVGNLCLIALGKDGCMVLSQLTTRMFSKAEVE